MLKTLHRLRPAEIANLLTRPGLHKDGGGLYLRVRQTGQHAPRAHWLYQRRVNGKTENHGLGPCPPMSLIQARTKRNAKIAEIAAADAMARPAPVRVAVAAAPAPRQITVESGKTFADEVELFIVENCADWKGGADGDEATQYRRTLIKRGTIGALTVGAINMDAIKKHSDIFPAATSRKVRGRISAVLYWIEHGKKKAVPKPVPHAAIDAANLPALMRELRGINSAAARALQFTILTAARTMETLRATQSEIVGDLWSIPGERMKEGRAHNVPLTPQARALIGNGQYLFENDGKPLGRRAMEKLMAEIRPGFKVHGFRSSFSTWAAEQGFDRDMRELALSHTIGSATAEAYMRSDLIERRREMMQAYADFATGGA